MDRMTRGLYAMAAVLLLLGLVLRTAPAPAEAVMPAPVRVAAATPSPEPARQPSATSAAIVDGNVFSPSRSAPKVRFTPPDLMPVEGRTRSSPPTRLRLFGTVLGPSGTAALIDADPKVRGAEIYQVGDTVDGRRIVAVSESTVVLDGAAGRLVLRLRPAGQPTR